MRFLPSRLKRHSRSSNNGTEDIGLDPNYDGDVKQELDSINNISLVLTVSIIKAQGLMNPKKKPCNAVC